MKKFKNNDIFYNQIKSHPQCDFIIYNKKIYYNQETEISGAHTSVITHVNPGNINLYELNIDRKQSEFIYPFVTKDGSLSSFKTVSTSSFNNFSYGDVMSGSYPLSASLSKDYFSSGSTRYYIKALRNTLERNKLYSPAYAYTEKATQELGLVSIPSIFYGSGIKKGSVELKFYVTGALIAEAKDEKQNGELIQTGPVGSNGSGSIAGVVLYKEGFIILTGSWDVSNGTHTEEYVPGGSNIAPKWIHFGTTGSSDPGSNVPSSSFDFNFKGTTKTPVITMFAHAGIGEFNHSNNPTYIKYNQNQIPITSSTNFAESDKIEIKNIIKTSYDQPDVSGSFEKQTYISRIGIYDKNKNLIAIAKLARPLRKKIKSDFTIKLKMDI